MTRVLRQCVAAGTLALALLAVAEARISPESAFTMGMAAYTKGDYGRAIEEFTKAAWYYIEEKVKEGWPMEPNDFAMGSQAYVYRGISYLKRGEPGKAEIDFQNAEKWGGQSSQARLAIGEAFFRVGRYDDSIRVLSKAVEAEPALGMAHYYLARSFYVKRDYDASWKHVKEAQRLGVPVTALVTKLRKAAPQLE